MIKKKKLVITYNEFQALQKPIMLPTPKDLLDFQVETLVGKKLLAYADADPFRKDLPAGLLILVPPRPKKLDLDHLMSLIVVDGVSGVSYLYPEYFKSEVEVPSGSYLMEGVEDGDARRTISPSVNRRNILAEGRSPFTIFEGMILGILFPEVLKHHSLDIVGSLSESEYHPLLCLVDARPRLGARWHDSAFRGWGAPSCGSRRGA